MYDALPAEKKREFVAKHYGFFQRVVNQLEADGTSVTVSTVSRTFYGLFRRPNPHVVVALEVEYFRVNDSEEAA
jgi:hypothetical protein